MPAEGRRQSLKAKSRADWPGALREECLHRVQQQREHLLQQCRTIPVHECLQSLFLDASKTLPQTPITAFDQSSETIVRGRADNEASNRSTDTKQLYWGGQHLTPEEYQELMVQMEEALFEDGYRDELEAIEASELEDMSELFAAHYITDTLPKSEHRDPLLCPVCEKAYLSESAFGTIKCPFDQFSIQAPLEGDRNSLDLLSKGISRILEGHRNSNCTEKPQFFVKDVGSSSLYMACYNCGALEIVI